MERMLLESDVPSYAQLEVLESIPGVENDEKPFQKHKEDLKKAVKETMDCPDSLPSLVMVQGATASGKSRLGPSAVAECVPHGKILCVTNLRIDVEGMQQAATVPSLYRNEVSWPNF